MYVATAGIYVTLAVPLERLADRWGRKRVFIGGYCVLLIAYAVLQFSTLGYLELAGLLLLFGTYYAGTNGVLMAWASSVRPLDQQASSLALLTTATSTAQFLASVLFGALWVTWGVEAATQVFLAALSIAVFGAVVLLIRMEKTVHHEPLATG